MASGKNEGSQGKVLNMTEGSPLRLILMFMVPVLLGQLVQQTYNMVDAMIVGRMLGADALASVGSSSSVQFMMLGFVSGASDGFAITVAQRFGAKDYRNLRRYAWHSLILAAVFSAVIAAAGSMATPAIITALKVPSAIRNGAIAYLMILFLGIPCSFFYNILASLLRAIGNSRIPFIFLTAAAVMNIFLDLLCVAVFGLGVAGAAIATVTSQALSGVFCLVYILKHERLLLAGSGERKPDKAIFGKLVSMGVPMGLQFSITAIGSMVMQAANNSLGSIYVSGFTAGDRVEQFFMCPYVGLSSSVATYVGQNYGAMKFGRIRQGVRASIIMAHIYGLIFGSLMALTGEAAAAWFLPAGSDRIVAISGQFLRLVGFSLFLVSSVNVYRPAMQGLGEPLKAILSGVVEMCARTLFATLTLRYLGFTTICLTHQAAWISAGIYVFLMYHAVIRKKEGQT